MKAISLVFLLLLCCNYIHAQYRVGDSLSHVKKTIQDYPDANPKDANGVFSLYYMHEKSNLVMFYNPTGIIDSVKVIPAPGSDLEGKIKIWLDNPGICQNGYLGDDFEYISRLFPMRNDTGGVYMMARNPFWKANPGQ